MTPKFVCVIVLLSIHGSDARLYNLFTPESRLSGFIIDKISPIGMVMCVRECSKRISCASLNYHRGRLECELSYSDATTNPSNITSDSEFIYIKRNQIPQVILSLYFVVPTINNINLFSNFHMSFHLKIFEYC